MLVLSRKTDETIRIGEEIRVRVLSIRGGRVRLGIEAPDSVDIVREEIEADFYLTCSRDPRAAVLYCAELQSAT